MSQQQQQSQQAIEQILLANGHYPPGAFAFVQRGLAFTVDRLGRQEKAEGQRHVTGQELCEGLRELAIRDWGHLARLVLNQLNVRRTDDFGRMVFYLIDNKLMQKQPQDTIDDFADVYDFADAFDRGYHIDLSKTKEKAAAE